MMRAIAPLTLLVLAACQQPPEPRAPATPASAPPIVPSVAAPAPPSAPPSALGAGPAIPGGGAAPEPGFRPSPQCPISGSGEWTAHINAMPGPGARRSLIVTGTISVKPAARTSLRLDPAVMESDPPQFTVILDVSLPSEPTIDTLTRRQMRGEWAIEGDVGAVHIRCGGRSLASIGDIVAQ